VILEATTYPGTTEELVGPCLEERSGLVAGKDFFLGYSPERIDPGNPTWNLINTPKVVSGVNEASLAAVKGFYDSIVDRTVPVSTPKEAELTKLLENTFRHVNVALINELANDVNDHMPDYVVRRLVVALNRRRLAVNGSRVLLLGLAYKPNTSDARESPAVVVADRLLALGAEVHAADPHVKNGHIDRRVTRVDLSADELKAADAVIILTDHDDFDYELVTTHARYVLDMRRRVSGPQVEVL
jgi:UDP-N-acetyl-D-mannosaminuronate dehydrogenase